MCLATIWPSSTHHTHPHIALAWCTPPTPAWQHGSMVASACHVAAWHSPHPTCPPTRLRLCSNANAIEYLKAENWDLERAVNRYFNSAADADMAGDADAEVSAVASGADALFNKFKSAFDHALLFEVGGNVSMAAQRCVCLAACAGDPTSWLGSVWARACCTVQRRLRVGHVHRGTCQWCCR